MSKNIKEKMRLCIWMFLAYLFIGCMWKTEIVAEASNFVPRTTAPANNNAYYYGWNPFYASGYGMPNCTAYAYGRAYELLGNKPNLSTGNAGQWWWYNKSKGAYNCGSAPRLGAIACWDNYDQNKGHVAVVEAINGSRVTLSESHYKGTFFDTRTMNANSSDYLTSKRFLGYIYIGDFGNVKPPSNPQISKNQIWYDLGDTIEVNAYAENATSYFMSMFKDGEKIISTDVSGGKFSMPANRYGEGNYSFYFSCSNGSGTVDTKWLDFSVVGAATYTRIYTNQELYDINDNITIGVDTVCAKGQVIGIDKEGVGRVYTESVSNPFVISAKALGVGDYSAYYSVFNGSGGTDTTRVYFSVGNCNINGNRPVDIGTNFYAYHRTPEYRALPDESKYKYCRRKSYR